MTDIDLYHFENDIFKYVAINKSLGDNFGQKFVLIYIDSEYYDVVVNKMKSLLIDKTKYKDIINKMKTRSFGTVHKLKNIFLKFPGVFDEVSDKYNKEFIKLIFDISGDNNSKILLKLFHAHLIYLPKEWYKDNKYMDTYINVFPHCFEKIIDTSLDMNIRGKLLTKLYEKCFYFNEQRYHLPSEIYRFKFLYSKYKDIIEPVKLNIDNKPTDPKFYTGQYYIEYQVELFKKTKDEKYINLCFEYIEKYIEYTPYLTEEIMEYYDFYLRSYNAMELYLESDSSKNIKTDEIHYLMAQILLSNESNNELEKREIIRHLIHANTHADAPELRTRLYFEYYFNLGLNSDVDFKLNNDIDTILNIGETIKKILDKNNGQN